ncbi:aminotransferase class III-fold pyridoxal phosphate-dependent enzyme [Cohnella faecalis]|uniref:Diaminobutyrate--2-oxoglutarate transaminase n=1 Tax=Cohnella faecalis TaxID=2315694 RepID=A0A398CKL1_9BACL|nr:aminotransferase class III-fold pyridoxal phosphate-dependent enzyme [Cohnella faecalis]
MTTGALAVTSNTRLRTNQAQPGVHFMPYPYCYRCPLGLKRDSCGLSCAKYLENALDNSHSGVDKPQRYWSSRFKEKEGRSFRLPAICGSCAGLRTSTNRCLYSTKSRPASAYGSDVRRRAFGRDADVMTMSKALGGIGYPISCIAYDKRLDTWEPGAHIGTFRGIRRRWQQAMPPSTSCGTPACRSMRRSWGALARPSEFVRAGFGSDRRSSGQGLMLGIEIVKDKHTKEPWPELVKEIRTACYKKGLLVEVGGHFSNVVRFLPPLVVTKELAEKGLGIFIEALESVVRSRQPA